MTHYDKMNRAIEDFKNCDPSQASEYFSVVCKEFSVNGKPEQKEIVKLIYQWAWTNANVQPLKFCYARCLRVVYNLLNEEYEEALHLVVETKNLFEEQNDRVGVGLCLVIMGCIYRTFGNLDLGLKTIWEGYGELKHERCPHLQLAGSCYMGGIYFDMGNMDEAIRYYKYTSELAEKTQDLIWINYALNGLGKVYLGQNKYDEADQYFRKALGLAEAKKNDLGISASLTELANLHFRSGNFIESEKLHKEAAVIRQKNNFIGGAITNYIQLAEISIRLSKSEEALELLHKGLVLAEQIKIKPKIYQIHSLLSRIYEIKMDFEKSLFHQKLFHEIREQVEMEDSAKKLKNVELIFEAEKTQKENAIIKRQKAEIERKNTELQETIDQLTLARVSKKARAITFVIAIALFIIEDSILHFALHLVSSDNYFISISVKMFIIFTLKPINSAVEHYLLKKVVKERRQKKDVFPAESDLGSSAA